MKQEVVRVLETNMLWDIYDLSLAVGNKQKFSLEATSNIAIGYRCYCTHRRLLAAILGGVGLLVRLNLIFEYRSLLIMSSETTDSNCCHMVKSILITR